MKTIRYVIEWDGSYSDIVQIETDTDIPIDADHYTSFAEAKSELLKSLRATVSGYRRAVRRTRSLKKADVPKAMARRWGP